MDPPGQFFSWNPQCASFASTTYAHAMPASTGLFWHGVLEYVTCRVRCRVVTQVHPALLSSTPFWRATPSASVGERPQMQGYWSFRSCCACISLHHWGRRPVFSQAGCGTQWEVAWFCEQFHMTDIRSVWPALHHTGRKHIACFESSPGQCWHTAHARPSAGRLPSQRLRTTDRADRSWARQALQPGTGFREFSETRSGLVRTAPYGIPSDYPGRLKEYMGTRSVPQQASCFPTLHTPTVSLPPGSLLGSRRLHRFASA